MSKHKSSYGRGRGNSRAGLQFDKLLKACSNSKKPPAAMAAGALGRFGVAQFTSTRSCGDSNEDHQEKPSRFSSLNKRPRLDKDAPPKSLHVNTTPNASSHMSALLDCHVPFNSPQTQTVVKPRKFFKSRGPMEVEVEQRARPDISNLVPPILSSNQSNINNYNTHSSSNQGSKPQELFMKHHHHTHSAPAQNLSSTVCSPPIKLKIIKEGSKFVSVAGTPALQQETKVARPSATSAKAKKKDKGKKREKRGKKQLGEGLAGETPSAAAPVGRPKGKKVTKKESAVPPPPRRTSGRVTRSSVRYREVEEDEDSQEGDQSLAGQENVTRICPVGSFVRSESVDVASAVNPNAKDALKNLEEDDEFQKLSQMLSSMEEDTGGASTAAVTTVPTNSQFNSSSGTSIETPSLNNSYNESQSFGSANFEDSGDKFHGSESYKGKALNEAESNDGMSGHYYGSSNGTEVVKNHESKIQDIRSILEDDWNETVDEECPKKTSGASLSQSSPPKTSRFDATAFMPPSTSENSANEVRREFPENIQRPIPVYGHQLSNSSAIQPPVALNSSPYAMKNLLGSGMNSSGMENPLPIFPPSASTSSEQPQNLVFPKYAAPESGSLAAAEPPNENSSLPPTAESNCSAVVNNSSSSSNSNINISSNNNISNEDNNNPSSSVSSQEQLFSQASSQSSQPLSDSSCSNSQSVSQPQPYTKKASIFKSRAAKSEKSDSSRAAEKKRQAIYKHTFGQMDKTEEQMDNLAMAKEKHALFSEFDECEDEEQGSSDLRLRKLRVSNPAAIPGFSTDEDPVSRVYCKRESKKLFTVVRNVKAGHELQESGEFHEFDGDVWYILEDLKDKNPINSRCLSAITLAGRCMDQSFRMHLRAHGTVAEFCKELHDAPQHPVLSLLAATVLFVLSQDRLNMDLDTESLKLILALTKSEPGNCPEVNESSENIKNRQRVLQLCSEMKNRGHAKHLDLEKITASELAMETLLYLTSKRAGEWVKHELRTLGGLDSIVGEVDSAFKAVKEEIRVDGWTPLVLEKLRKIDRCLQVLQQVTFNHEDNQRYLMQVSTRVVDGGSVKCTDASPLVFLEMFQFCKDVICNEQKNFEHSVVVREVLFSVLRLLVNLSHDYRGIVLGSEIMLGIDGFLELALHSTFEMIYFFPDEKVFDLLMHSLCLLLNLVEYSKKNRNRLLEFSLVRGSNGNYRVPSEADSFTESCDSGVEEKIGLLDVLIEMFLSKERSAKKDEQQTDNILTTGDENRSQSQESTSSGVPACNSSRDQNSQDQEGSSVQDTIDKLIQTAGKHMENSLIAAYISLLIGYLVMDNSACIDYVKDAMPENKLLPLMVVLKKLFNFMSITSSASGSNRGLKATAVALKFYAKADPDSNQELKKIVPD